MTVLYICGIFSFSFFGYSLISHGNHHLTVKLLNHDLSLDPAAGDLGNFRKRSLDNFNNRCLHHYVYNDELLMEICNYFKLKFIYKETQGINRWFIMQKIGV